MKKVYTLEDLKAGMVVKLKKLEECKETKSVYSMSHKIYASERKDYAEKLVTICNVVDKYGNFSITDDGGKYYYSPEWIEKVAKDGKFEDFKIRWNEKMEELKSEKVEKFKPGDLVRFPNKERYKELLKDEKYESWRDSCVKRMIEHMFDQEITLTHSIYDSDLKIECWKTNKSEFHFPDFIFDKVEKFPNFKCGDIVKVVKIDENEDCEYYQKTLGMIGKVEIDECCDVMIVYFQELDMNFEYYPGELQKIEKCEEVQKFQNLKFGTKIRLKKEEFCRESNVFASDWMKKMEFCEKIVTFKEYSTDKKKFLIKELKQILYFPIDWIEDIQKTPNYADKVVSVQPMAFPKCELLKHVEFKFLKKDKKMKNYKDLKPGDVVRFPSEEEYRELLKDEKWKDWSRESMIKNFSQLYGKETKITYECGEWNNARCFNIEKGFGYRFPDFIFDKIEKCEESENIEISHISKDYKFLENFKLEDYEKNKKEVRDYFHKKPNSNLEESLKSTLEQINILKKMGYWDFSEDSEVIYCVRHETILEYLARLEREERLEKLK